jgi:hypothetical protein
MYRDAVKTSGNEGGIEVVDIVDLLAQAMQETNDQDTEAVA